MQAVILAAGMGKRLKNLTAKNTKCMVEVNGKSLIERMLSILNKKKLSKIIIVVGYEGQRLIDHIAALRDVTTPIFYIWNDKYDKTNNIYSLSLAKEYLVAEDTLLLESDLIFEESVLDVLLNDPRESLALVDKYKSWMDGTCVILNENDCIREFVLKKQFHYKEARTYYKTVNVYKFSRRFSEKIYVPFLEAYTKAMGENEYYESVLKVISILDTNEIQAKRLDGQLWYEIDDIQDLDIAQSMFIDLGGRYQALTRRYGGYWRYPEMIDFCYLVNPYYPPTKMIDEMQSVFDTLLTQYPSGMRVNRLLAAKYFDIRQEYIVVGNGAAELIRVLMETLEGTVGFIRPTFEEYPNRYDVDKSVYMETVSENFDYTAANIISFFNKKQVESIILINPDNPSGNYISYEDVLRLLEWCRKQEILLVLDESFVDFVADSFTENKKVSLLQDEVLEAYPDNLIVVKSISKCFGVPGIRLGILACGSQKRIVDIQAKTSIWNLNSFGEYYMQIAEKYRVDYREAMAKLKNARDLFFKGLKEISFLRPIPSEANYIMCEVTGGRTSEQVAQYLLGKHYLIKDLTGKIHNGKEYIRLAVRDEKDNAGLLAALKQMGQIRQIIRE